MMRRVAVPAVLLFLLFVASSFLYVQLTKALTKPLCCADDAYFSLIAKNLALNVTYGVPAFERDRVALQPSCWVRAGIDHSRRSDDCSSWRAAVGHLFDDRHSFRGGTDAHDQAASNALPACDQLTVRVRRVPTLHLPSWQSC
jgi:hypothetical protein